MITHRIWLKNYKVADRYGRSVRYRATKEGWFLLGIIPLYIITARIEEL